MDSTRTEIIAVNAVINYVCNCPCLVPHIHFDDKNPFWDGEIFIYNNDDVTNSNYYGKVPVQVKGTNITNKKFASELSYNGLDRNDYKAYLYDHGVLLFVVQIESVAKEDEQKYLNSHIFYNVLNVESIYKILSKSKAKKPTIYLYPIETDYTSFYNKIKEFHESRVYISLSSFAEKYKVMQNKLEIIDNNSDYLVELKSITQHLANFRVLPDRFKAFRDIHEEALKLNDILANANLKDEKVRDAILNHVATHQINFRHIGVFIKGGIMPQVRDIETFNDVHNTYTKKRALQLGRKERLVYDKHAKVIRIEKELKKSSSPIITKVNPKQSVTPIFDGTGVIVPIKKK